MITLYRVRAVWTGLAGAPYLSTFYFDENTVVTQQAAIDAVRVFLTQAQDRYSNDLSVQVEPEVAVFSTPDTLVSVSAWDGKAAIAGNDSGNETARATQGLLQLRTGIYAGGREVRGRIFIPGVTSTSIGTEGRPSTTYRDLLTVAAGNLITAGLHVASKKNNLFYEVASINCWSEFAVLRGRQD